MSIKPILMNAEMVRALLDGRKTVTRRVVKPQHLRVLDSKYHREHPEVSDKTLIEKLCEPPYRPGDILYVRETWAPLYANYSSAEVVGYMYRSDTDCQTMADYDRKYPDGKEWTWEGRWRPSIHMPREAARIFLRVTDVRVERLQDGFFTQGDTIAAMYDEGVDIGEQCRQCIENYGNPCCNDIDPELEPGENGEDENGGSECGMLDEVRSDFASLWDSTIKSADRTLYGWAADPLVWVTEFERCGKPNNFDTPDTAGKETL